MDDMRKAGVLREEAKKKEKEKKNKNVPDGYIAYR